MENKPTWIRADTHRRLKIQSAKMGINLIDLMDSILVKWLDQKEQFSTDRIDKNGKTSKGGD